MVYYRYRVIITFARNTVGERAVARIRILIGFYEGRAYEFSF